MLMEFRRGKLGVNKQMCQSMRQARGRPQLFNETRGTEGRDEGEIGPGEDSSTVLPKVNLLMRSLARSRSTSSLSYLGTS